MGERIRWQDTPIGSICGYVGTMDEWAFQIYKPERASGEWALIMSLPRIPGRVSYADNPDELKPEAEKLLAEFAASLGAIFTATDSQPVTSRCECGGLARHQEKCGWRQGYGSVVIGTEAGTPQAGEGDQ